MLRQKFTSIYKNVTILKNNYKEVHMHIHLPGVYTAKHKDGSVYYRASITYRNKHISLGSYSTESIAHAAYLEGGSILCNSEITISKYTKESALPFEKWICLLNFRDNGIYFATPIYVRPKFFYYYFSPEKYFIFDTDDLFYYASRKITVRGGHYFVADYGMQVNIASRYGIKNYAVEGRDYRFRNGNNHDFRYENIEILSHYNGVEPICKDGRTLFKVRIHVKGNYTVGVYNTEQEAAIAYNKAADLLKKAGVKKEYSLNYMEGISPSVYADLYSSVSVSGQIENYRSE